MGRVCGGMRGNMAFVDERIAMLEREWRKQRAAEAEQLNAKEDESVQEKMTLEEMLARVREGCVAFSDHEKYTFEVRSCFADKIPMVLIHNFYTGVQEEEGVAIYVNHDRNISQILTVADKEMGKESIGKWKRQLEDGMKMSGSYAEVIKEKVLDNLDYLVFRSPTGEGWVYNLIFRIRAGSSRVVGNYNCFEKDQDTCGLMLEALVCRLDELLSV